MTEAHIQRQKLALLITDVLAFLIAFATGMQLRFGAYQLSVFEFGNPPWEEMLTALPFMLGAWLISLTACGAYRIGKKQLFLDFARIVQASFFFIGVLLSAIFFYRGFEYSRGFALVFLAANLSLTFFGRVFFRILRARIESDVRHQVDALLREAGITIAYPQRDLHLRAAAPLEVRVLSRPPDEPPS